MGRQTDKRGIRLEGRQEFTYADMQTGRRVRGKRKMEVNSLYTPVRRMATKAGMEGNKEGVIIKYRLEVVLVKQM